MKCEDLYKGRTIAIKIIKNVKKYREAAKLEINVLSKLAKYDPKVTVLDRKKMSNGRGWEIWVKHAGGELVRANVRLLRLPWPSVHRLRAAGFVKKISSVLPHYYHFRSECVRLLEGQQLSSLSCGAGGGLCLLESGITYYSPCCKDRSFHFEWLLHNNVQVRQVAYELCLSVSFLHSVSSLKSLLWNYFALFMIIVYFSIGSLTRT